MTTLVSIPLANLPAGSGTTLQGDQGAAAGTTAPSGSSTRAAMNFTDYEVEYALITSEALAPTYQPLVDWKIQKGLKAKLYVTDGTSGIYTSYINGDNARRIHDFLVALKGNSPNLKYVTIGGDSQIIPSRHMWAGARLAYGNTEWEDFYYSDYYYAGLGSSWDTDGDGIYGEPGEEDISPDVYVGRLPSKGPGEAKIMVDRIVKYESNITDGDWLSRGFFAASLMDSPNLPDNPATNTTDEGYNDYKDNAFEGMQESLAYVPARIQRTELYDYSQIPGGDYTLANDTLTSASFKAEMNKGYGIINYLGQAFFGGNELAHYDNKTGTGRDFQGFKPLYTYADAKAMSNGNKAGLIVMATCDSGNFTETDDTNLETFLKAPNGGAVGFIASSGRSYRGEHEDGNSYGNWWFSKFLLKNFYEGQTVQGELLYDLKEEYYNKIYTNCPLPKCVIGNVYGYNLMGDPETDIYNDRASTFAVTTSAVYSGANTVTVTVKDAQGTPVSGAKVSLMGLGVLVRGTTGSDGKASIELDAPGTGSMTMTVTKHNFKAGISTVAVKDRPLDLKVGDEDMVLEAAVAVPGQDILINTTVTNNADIALTGITATLSDSYYEAGSMKSLNIEEFTFDIPAASSKNLVAVLSTTVPGDHNLTLTLDPGAKVAESDESNNQARGTVHIDHAPVLKPIPAVRILEDDTKINALDLTGANLATDPDNSSYELSFGLVSNENESCFISVSSGGIVSVVPEPDWNGETTAYIYVSDGMLETAQPMMVTVDPVDDPPVIEAVADQPAYLDQRFTLNAKGEDRDKGDVLRYSDDSPLFEINSTSGTISFIPYEENAGTYTVTITVTDLSGLSDKTTFNLTIKENDQPHIEAASFSLEAGKTFRTTIGVKNAPAGRTYTFSDNTDLFDIDPSTGKIEFKPGDDDVGKHSVKITATDTTDGSRAEGVITLEVKEATEGSGVVAVLIVLLIIVIIGMGVVVFYFFIRPNMVSPGGAGEEEEDDDEDDEGPRRSRSARTRRKKDQEDDDDGGERSSRGRSARPRRRRGGEEEEEQEDDKESKGLLSSILKKDGDDDEEGEDGEEEPVKKVSGGKRSRRSGNRFQDKKKPIVVKPRKVMAPVGAKKPKKDGND